MECPDHNNQTLTKYWNDLEIMTRMHYDIAIKTCMHIGIGGRNSVESLPGVVQEAQEHVLGEFLRAESAVEL